MLCLPKLHPINRSKKIKLCFIFQPKVTTKKLKKKVQLKVSDVQDLYPIDSMEEISTERQKQVFEIMYEQAQEYKLLKKEYLYFLLVIIILSFSFYSFI